MFKGFWVYLCCRVGPLFLLPWTPEHCHPQLPLQASSTSVLKPLCPRLDAESPLLHCQSAAQKSAEFYSRGYQRLEKLEKVYHTDLEVIWNWASTLLGFLSHSCYRETSYSLSTDLSLASLPASSDSSNLFFPEHKADSPIFLKLLICD